VRSEGRIVFAELARRFPGMEVAATSLSWTSNSLLRRLSSLPVALGTARPQRTPVPE
jgi:cytochrome P450